MDLERELGVTQPAELVTGTRDEVSAWFAARYMLKTARGLREAMPQPGDIAVSHGWPADPRVISSIGADGRIYMKGRPPRKAWPNHLEVVIRVGDPAHAESVEKIDAELRNRASYNAMSLSKFYALAQYALRGVGPTTEAVRELEELLECGETREEPFQALLTRHPGLLASTVVGGWRTYVIPKQRLGAEYVPDFLVLGINSIGPQWVTVELEAPRHRILNRDGSLTSATRQGVGQIQDWREWLTHNVAYAHQEHHLHGLTNRAPGLVIIGRSDPAGDRDTARAQSGEGPDIAIHSWDWLLRHARNLVQSAINVSEFARDNLGRGGATPDVVNLAAAKVDSGDLEDTEVLYLDDDL